MGSCGFIVFYAKSFKQTDGAKPQAIVVNDWCSPQGIAQAFFNGLHEGYHKNCPDGTDQDGCEEISTSIQSIVEACNTAGNALNCFCGTNAAACEQMASDFPDLLDENGALDPDKVLAFGKELCKAMDVKKDQVDKQMAFACACGVWNETAPATCKVPPPPDNPDGSSGCDGDGPPDDPNWPVPACDPCAKMNSADPCAK